LPGLEGRVVANSLSFKSIAGLETAGTDRLRADLSDAAILVVDDFAPGRALVAAQLEASGFRNVESVGSVTQALDALRARRPELIISDLLMPGMSGLDLCRILRADPELADIPILAQTATMDPDLRAMAFASGATDLFTKPYDANELLCRVRILLERRRLIDRLTEFQEMIAEDLRQAADAQEGLLPSAARIEQLMTLCPLKLASLYEASAGLGGDLWGIDLLGPSRVLIFNADFAGHGVSAALNTVRLHSFIQTATEKPTSPAALLGNINQFLCNVLPTGQFATMFCAIMDFRNHSLEYASAAAPPQLLRSAAGRPFEIIEEPGFPLGVTREASFDNRVAAFAPGAMLLLFSDALIETPPPPNAVFTADLLRDFVNGIPAGGGPHALCERVLRHLFRKIEEKPADDLTFIAAEHVMREQTR
jgi:sigma-B regulation protein RsbU (phosphoserine phosphatase)